MSIDRIIVAHGQADGEPGPATIHVQISNAEGVVQTTVTESIGNSTSDFAAYTAVLRGLQLAVDLDADTTTDLVYEVHTDSVLVQNQLSHTQPITETGLIPFFIEIHNLRVAHFPNLTLTHVKRELNKEADRLVNEALDAAS